MKPKDVVNNLISGKNYNRIGVYEHFWSETVRKWVENGEYPYTVDNNGNKMLEDICDHFQLDMRCIWSPIDHMPIKGYSETVEETDEWTVIRNGAGAVLKWWKHKTGTPEHVGFHMISRDIWEKEYRGFLLELDITRINNTYALNELEKGKHSQQWTYYGDLFVWEIMRQSMGDICLFESMILDPDWIMDFCRVYTDFFKLHYKELFRQLPMPDGIWLYDDLAYRNGLFCSPQAIEKLILPYYKEIVDFFHSYNLPVIFHSCGRIDEAIPLIIEAGFDGLNPMEVKAGCDILKYARTYGDKLVFVGGLDVRILETGDQTLIKRETVKLINDLKECGARFLFGSDHSISSAVSYKDYRYMLDVYRENMWY